MAPAPASADGDVPDYQPRTLRDTAGVAAAPAPSGTERPPPEPPPALAARLDGTVSTDPPPDDASSTSSNGTIPSLCHDDDSSEESSAVGPPASTVEDCTTSSTSAAPNPSSPDWELLRDDEDLGAPLRWAAALTDPSAPDGIYPNVSRTVKLEGLHESISSPYIACPPGCLLDERRPISPQAVGDFPSRSEYISEDPLTDLDPATATTTVTPVTRLVQAGGIHDGIGGPSFRPSVKVFRISGGVYNYVSLAMRLTRSKLLRQEDWSQWQESEYKQLDQYMTQEMFGDPVPVDSDAAVFNLVWTYVVKELDKRKKARCTCDGSTRAGQVRILDYTYANCVDQTTNRLFYALSAAENLIIFGADVSNAFGEAPPPKQGFYIRPDKAFRDWWEEKLGRSPIPHGWVIPVLAAMQGHPEAPRLWERHADSILRSLGLKPTIHEPCLYAGVVRGERVLFKRQVDDFEVAVSTAATASILFDQIDDRLTFPLKRMGLVTLFNGLDILQTRHFIKMSCTTYIEKISNRHLADWMNVKDMPNKPTPLPTAQSFIRGYLSTVGDPDVKAQSVLATKMGFFLSQGHRSCPAEIHYHGVRHCLKYLYITRDDGIYFWRPEPREDLPEVAPPRIMSNFHDLLMDGRPDHDALELHAYMDSDWAACPRTRRSFGGRVLFVAGGPSHYRANLQPTVSDSSTMAELIEASNTGKGILFVRSVMYDLGIPQGAATLAYEDNDATTSVANSEKPTPRTRHVDIRYFALCEWVERDLMKLECIDTSQNISDNLTKQLGTVLFYRHTDYIMGRVPPKYSVCYRRAYDTLRRQQPTRSNITPVPSILGPDHPAAAAAARLILPVSFQVDILGIDLWGGVRVVVRALATSAVPPLTSRRRFLSARRRRRPGGLSPSSPLVSFSGGAGLQPCAISRGKRIGLVGGGTSPSPRQQRHLRRRPMPPTTRGRGAGVPSEDSSHRGRDRPPSGPRRSSASSSRRHGATAATASSSARRRPPSTTTAGAVSMTAGAVPPAERTGMCDPSDPPPPAARPPLLDPQASWPQGSWTAVVASPRGGVPAPVPPTDPIALGNTFASLADDNSGSGGGRSA
ncbi:hypothetical protein ACHAWF_014575 [Thalassiosira exigua]